MNAEVKEKWLAALRSGKYKQGMNALRTNDAYCCLGVLCELAVIEGIIDQPDTLPLSASMTGYLYEGSLSYLPRKVVEWSGLGARSPKAGQIPLYILNDEGNTFAEIADLIEKQI